MRLRALHTDDDAVSPVIGVILMVAITVILAAVIGTFVLGLGDRVGTDPPRAQFSTDFAETGSPTGDDCLVSGGDGDLTVTHEGGETVESGSLYLSQGGNKLAWVDDCGGDENANSEVDAGAAVEVQANTDMTVRIVWESADGETSQTLATWDGSDA